MVTLFHSLEGLKKRQTVCSTLNRAAFISCTLFQGLDHYVADFARLPFSWDFKLAAPASRGNNSIRGHKSAAGQLWLLQLCCFA